MEPEDVENAPSTSSFHCMLFKRSNSPETQILDLLETKIKVEINIENQECQESGEEDKNRDISEYDQEHQNVIEFSSAAILPNAMQTEIKVEIKIENQEFLESGEEDKNRNISVYDQEQQNAIEFGEFSSATILPNATQEMIPTEYAIDIAIIKSYPCDDYENNQPQLIDNNNHFPEVTISTMSRQEMIRDILENIAFVGLPRIEYFQRNFVCSTCYAIYDCFDALQAHDTVHSSDHAYTCDICPYKCSLASALKSHKLCHLKEPIYKCEQCDYVSKHTQNVKRHVMTVHENSYAYKCNECEYKTKTASELKIHVLKHSGVYPFRCKICPFKTTRSKFLKVHAMRHTGEKKHKCDVCGYKTHYYSNMWKHKKIHNGRISTFECDLCEEKFIRSSHLRRHKRTH